MITCLHLDGIAYNRRCWEETGSSKFGVIKMALVVLMKPNFIQTEDNKIDGHIGVNVLDIETTGKDLKIPLEVSQNLVSYEGERALVEVYALEKVNEELSIIMLVNEEGSFYIDTPQSKLDNGDKLSEADLKWIPWPSPLHKDPRPVFGNILIVKAVPNDWCGFKEHEVTQVIEFLQKQQEQKLQASN